MTGQTQRRRFPPDKTLGRLIKMVSPLRTSHGVMSPHTRDPERVGRPLHTMLQAGRQRLQQDDLFHDAVESRQAGDSQADVPGEEHVHSRQPGDDPCGVT